MAKLTRSSAPRSHLLLSRKPRSRVALAAPSSAAEMIVMPVTTPTLKVDAVRARGAVVLHGESYSDAETEAHRLMAEQGLEFVHPFDDPDVIAGQGTIAMELLVGTPARSTLSSSPSGRRADLGHRHLPQVAQARHPDHRCPDRGLGRNGPKCRCG